MIRLEYFTALTPPDTYMKSATVIYPEQLTFWQCRNIKKQKSKKKKNSIN